MQLFSSGSFITRYVLNSVFINSAMQMLQLPMFIHQFMIHRLGKDVRRWDFNFGYWYAFHLSMLAVCLTFAIDFPMVPFLGYFFFMSKYWVDKYNLCFRVWRIATESAGAVAKTPWYVIQSFFIIFLVRVWKKNAVNATYLQFLMASFFIAMALSADVSLGNRSVEKGLPTRTSDVTP